MGHRWVLVKAIEWMAVEGGRAATPWVLERVTRAGRIDRALRELMRLGWVETGDGGPLDARVFRLTGAGRQTACLGLDPEKLWTRPWDGRWRIVAFDIPETAARKRVALRRQLRRRRFGWMQNSLWISPDPLDTVRREIGETGIEPESMLLLDAVAAGGEPDAAVAKGAWDFGRINRCWMQYAAILRERPGRVGQQLPHWRRWLDAEAKAWREVVQRDPFLPAVLLPEDYCGRAVWMERRAALNGR